MLRIIAVQSQVRAESVFGTDSRRWEGFVKHRQPEKCALDIKLPLGTIHYLTLLSLRTIRCKKSKDVLLVVDRGGTWGRGTG